VKYDGVVEKVLQWKGSLKLQEGISAEVLQCIAQALTESIEENEHLGKDVLASQLCRRAWERAVWLTISIADQVIRLQAEGETVSAASLRRSLHGSGISLLPMREPAPPSLEKRTGSSKSLNLKQPSPSDSSTEQSPKQRKLKRESASVSFKESALATVLGTPPQNAGKSAVTFSVQQATPYEPSSLDSGSSIPRVSSTEMLIAPGGPQDLLDGAPGNPVPPDVLAPLFAPRTVAEPKYSREELLRHNSRKECWVAIFGVVYDISELLSKHPGGQAALLLHAGKESSRAFLDNHSKESNAARTLQNYRIGLLDRAPATQRSPTGPVRPPIA
jgi:cytochrome b involved in lipid metabolism